MGSSVKKQYYCIEKKKTFFANLQVKKQQKGDKLMKVMGSTEARMVNTDRKYLDFQKVDDGPDLDASVCFIINDQISKLLTHEKWEQMNSYPKLLSAHPNAVVHLFYFFTVTIIR